MRKNYKDCNELKYKETRDLLSGNIFEVKNTIPINIGFYNFNKKNNIIINKFLEIDLKNDYNFEAKSQTNYFKNK